MANQRWDAALYDNNHSFVAEYGKGLVELLKPQSGERILDVGCGTGPLTHEISQSGATVIGFDASAAMIAKARLMYPDLQFDIKDVAAFSYDQPFDAVFSNATLHWVHQADEAAACMSQALKPDGRFVVELGGHGNVEVIAESLKRAIYEALGVQTQHPWFFPSVATYSGILDRHQLEVTAAWLFDRPTKLEGANGLRNWCRMFAGSMLNPLPEAQQELVLARVDELCRVRLLKDGTWYADYRRLRVVARKV